MFSNREIVPGITLYLVAVHTAFLAINKESMNFKCNTDITRLGEQFSTPFIEKGFKVVDNFTKQEITESQVLSMTGVSDCVI